MFNGSYNEIKSAPGDALREREERYKKLAYLLPQTIFELEEESIGLRGFVADPTERKRARKFYLFVTLFLIISLFYLLLLFVFPRSSLAQVTNIFQSVWANLIVLVVFFLFIAFGLSELTDFFYRKLRRMRWFRPKLGKILVSKGYLTEGELKETLSEQRLRIGEVLVQAGRITAQQLNQALDYQKKISRKLGEILRELGHATEKDINWALDRMDRRLGKILQEKGLLTEHEFYRIWALQRYGP